MTEIKMELPKNFTENFPEKFPDKLPGADNLWFLEELYAAYALNPTAVDPSWRQYFDRLKAAGGPSFFQAAGASSLPDGLFYAASVAATSQNQGSLPADQHAVDRLIEAYRREGHQLAQLNPLAEPAAVDLPVALQLASYGLSSKDLTRTFRARGLGPGEHALSTIISRLTEIYCGPIGVQFMHIDDLSIVAWLQQRLEDPAQKLAQMSGHNESCQR